MPQVNYPASAQKLSVKVILDGILNATGRIEYDEADQMTVLWGPVALVNGQEYVLEKTAADTCAQQNGRSTYILTSLRNFTGAAVPAKVTVEFYQQAGVTKTLLQSFTLFDGEVAAKSEVKPSDIYTLSLQSIA